ncbi:hypothetical protein F5I97DRAFT_1811758 [Phlebopus sp. FC_14]|nr:hypothetical protein F5I97DRAFT_1811758 [Phlebopus sp. FC_14]
MVQTRSSSKKEGTHDVEKGTRSATKPGLSLAPSASFDDFEDVAAEDDFEYKPTKKRHKGHKNNQPQSSKRGLRGRLEMMPQMNLDVLFHIFSFLHPMDLLNLARTAKTFRQLLMQKSSAFIWKTSRLQLEDFPDCPADLSEPQFINLAFYPHCHLDNSLRNRLYCEPPVSDGMVLPEECLSLDTRECAAGVLSYLFHYLYIERFARLVDVQKVDAFWRKYRSLSETKTEEFLQNTRLQTRIISEHARECESWLQKMTAARKRELLDARDARKEEIFKRIIDLGYKFEIDCFSRWEIAKSERTIFNSSKPLSDREWNRLRPTLVKKMEIYRTQGQENYVYRPRRVSLILRYDRYARKPAPPGAEIDILPHVADLATFAPFVAIIHRPRESKVDENSFDPAFEQLPALVQEWRENVEAQLASLIVFPSNTQRPKPKTLAHDQEAVKAAYRLKLASAVFIEKQSDTLITYPHVLYFTRFNHAQPYSSDLEHAAAVIFQARPWSICDSGGQPVVQFFAGAAHVVRACGLDPESATAEDMEKRDARLVCNICSVSPPLVRTWKNAVRSLIFIP